MAVLSKQSQEIDSNKGVFAELKIELKTNINQRVSNENLQQILSRKEVQIISLLSQGLTYKIIANELDRSPRTVEHHIESIKAKLNLNCKTEIIKFFQNGGIKKP